MVSDGKKRVAGKNSTLTRGGNPFQRDSVKPVKGLVRGVLSWKKHKIPKQTYTDNFCRNHGATNCILINNAVTWRCWIRWMCIRRRARVANCEPNFRWNLRSVVSYSRLKRNAIIFTRQRHRFTFSAGCTKKTTTNTCLPNAFRQLTRCVILLKCLHTDAFDFDYPGHVSSL